jgi:hypothetical protein
MKKSKNSRPAWLLTVASAYALLPACGDDIFVGDVTIPPPDAGQLSIDAGSTVKPPDAGPLYDAGGIVRPPDAAVDASSDQAIGLIARPALDASVDAAQPWVGLVVRSRKLE